MPRDAFVRVIGPVFENSPWIAAATWSRKPFAGVEELNETLCRTVREAGEKKQVDLIRAHPNLVGRAAREGTLTPASRREQAGAGLDQLSSRERNWFRKQNAAYREKFGFPFVICARLNKKEAIVAGFKIRLRNSRRAEIQAAVEEIFKIASLRLTDLISAGDMIGKLSTHVLDTAYGCPAAGMEIELWRVDGRKRILLKTVCTNADGRTETPLLAGTEFKRGEYELVFGVGDYFAKKKSQASTRRFLGRVPVRFGVADPKASYHVPLLCSPWAYSTYRGS
jgi:2-oxo-4-hydroxy-4-carboxy-5-ureidoimidazoline decarboxylase